LFYLHRLLFSVFDSSLEYEKFFPTRTLYSFFRPLLTFFFLAIPFLAMTLGEVSFRLFFALIDLQISFPVLRLPNTPSLPLEFIARFFKNSLPSVLEISLPLFLCQLTFFLFLFHFPGTSIEPFGPLPCSRSKPWHGNVSRGSHLFGKGVFFQVPNPFRETPFKTPPSASGIVRSYMVVQFRFSFPSLLSFFFLLSSFFFSHTLCCFFYHWTSSWCSSDTGRTFQRFRSASSSVPFLVAATFRALSLLSPPGRAITIRA